MGITYQIIAQVTYEQVSADSLLLNTSLPADIFVRDKSVIQPIFFKGTLFTETTRAFLKERGITELYVRREDAPVLHQTPLPEIPRESLDTAWSTYASQKEHFCQIYKQVLIPGTRIDFSLYIQEGGIFRPLLETDDKSPAIVDEHLLNTENDLLIKNSDIPRYQNYLLSLKQPDQAGDSVRKAIIIKENSKIVLKNLLDDPRSGKKIKEVEVLVKDMIGTILDDKNTIYALISLKNYDYYTYTHSVNVAVLSIGLGNNIGLTKDKVEELGMGAILHDIGKSCIPSTVLNKPAKLNDDELLLVKNHVAEGAKILKTYKKITGDSFRAAVEHHERLSGMGYPARLSGKEISLFGRITAIADAYDAMTTQRCYQPPYTPFFALRTITQQTEHYDPDLLKSFIRMLGNV